MPTTRATLYQQRGAALLLTMLIVIMTTSAILLSHLSRDDLRTRRLLETRSVLAMAKTALVDYALVNPDVNFGRSISLPCPDIDDTGGFDDGSAHTTSCGVTGETVVGRLPWRTLGVEAVKDATSTCLWYVVSGSYKDADTETAAMINTDSNGQLQLVNLASGNVIEGLAPEDRPVAMVIAAMQATDSQTRPASVPGSPCAPGANPINYLDTDIGSGISNAALTGLGDTIDIIATYPGRNEEHNDRVITISRRDIARRVNRRADFESGMRSLGLAAASCLADYAAGNSGGAGDKRLPWPANVAMSDYRMDTSYDDVNSGLLAGRLPDIVTDSNLMTGNAIGRVLSDCNSVAVPDWSSSMYSSWQNWKDHFFYAVADSHSPSAATPSTCSSCLTVNGSGQYAAVLLFSNSRLPGLGQVRNAPPIDSDTKSNSSNYLEGANATNIPGTGVSTNYASGPESAVFNDLLFCIDDQLVVTEC